MTCQLSPSVLLLTPLMYYLSSCICHLGVFPSFFFFNDTATTEIYTLSLHDALPICALSMMGSSCPEATPHRADQPREQGDRKSTRLNSSHLVISYAVFCLKKKKNPFYDL